MNSENFPTIPNYQIESEIGQGGMAIVYKGRHASLDRPVAIKLLKPDMVANSMAISRFLKEPKILARFIHPNIVTVYDSGFLDEQQQQRYLVMEYLPGLSLKDRMSQGRLARRALLDIMKAITRALELAHDSGVIHRDIKPDNILFRENGTPVLTDFGIAKDLDSHTQATAAGTLLGTYRYMSPEQFQGLELDGRSDLYSMGILLVEILTGDRPFDGKSFEILLTRRLTEPAPRLPPDCGEFQTIVDRLLNKDPNRRYASAGELLAALEDLEAALGLADPPAELPVIEEYQAQEEFDETTRALTAVESADAGGEASAGFSLPPRYNRRRLTVGFAAAVILALAVFLVPAMWDALQIRNAEAAVDKLQSELAAQQQDLQTQLSGVEGILQQLNRQKQNLQEQIRGNRQQHAQTLQQLERQKSALEQEIQQQQTEAGQSDAQFVKQRLAQETIVADLRQQLTLLQRQTSDTALQAKQRIAGLEKQEEQLRQELKEAGAQAQRQQQHATTSVQEKQTQLDELKQQLTARQTQNRQQQDKRSGQQRQLSEQLEQLSAGLEKARSQQVQEQEKFAALEAALKQKMAETRQQTEGTESAVQALRDDIGKLEQQLAEQQQQTRRTISDSDGEIAGLQQRHAELQEKLRQQTAQAAEAQQRYKQEVAVKQAALEQLQSSLDSSRQRQQAVQTQHEQKMAELTERASGLDRELEQITKQTEQQQQIFTNTYTTLRQGAVITSRRLQQSGSFVGGMQQKLTLLEQQDSVAPVQDKLGKVEFILDDLKQELEPLMTLIEKEERQQAQINELLDKARKALDRNALTRPDNNNAVLWAEQILDMEPAHPQARAIISDVIDKYLGWKNIKQAGLLENYFSAGQLKTYVELGGVARGNYLDDLIN